MVCFDIYGLRMAFGSLSTNGQCCVSVLLMFWHRASAPGACWPLGGVSVSVRGRPLGELLLT